MNDIDIANSIKLKNITEISTKINLQEDEIETYGKYKAKLNYETIQKRLNKKDNGKLILVTSINPTPYGEGKTTVSIGLADAINKINNSAILALREPSLGPVFGIKGGATGGGYSQIAPMEDINLHFTGDIHAVTSANNLLSAIIDNHIYQGNELKIKKVVWKRCLDLNDRQLRKIETGLSGEKKIVPREDGFDISVASEIMAILCLANDLTDLKRRIGNIVIGYNDEGKEVTAKDLKAQGAMSVLLKDAIKPNLVQTLEHTPCIVHGGPFANIAHGCNSIIATKTALKLADYTVTEAGFGSDLGAEKFLNIKCRKLQKTPDCVVIVATVRALKYHGGQPKEEVTKENLEALKLGIENLKKHINNMKNEFGLNVVVAINKFKDDTEGEINLLQQELEKLNVKLSLVTSYAQGSIGAEDLANKVIEECNRPNNFEFIYNLDDTIEEKIYKVATKIYGAKGVTYSEEAEEQLKAVNNSKLPVCIAKTQYSFSDDAKNLQCKEPFTIYVNEINLKAGAEFVVAITGKIMTMPGLPKVPSAENIDIDENGKIVGIF